MGLMCYRQYVDGTFIAIEPKAMLAHDFQSGLTKSNQPGRLTTFLVLIQPFGASILADKSSIQADCFFFLLT